MAHSQGSSSQLKKRKAKLLRPQSRPARVVNLLTLQLLFEKKLTPYDLSRLNRMIVPKAHAEEHFSEFKEEGSAYIFMDDRDVPKVWRFCLRNFLNNGRASKYVLEGVGKYLAERNANVGDYVMIYKDLELQRYAIGWRKEGPETHDASPDEVKNIDLPQSSSTVAFEETNNRSPEELEKVDLPGTQCEVALPDDNHQEFAPANETDQVIQPSKVSDEPPTGFTLDFTNDYRPQFSPKNDTSQSTCQSEIIGPEYVQKKFHMSWEEFLDFNPFDFPTK